MHQRRSGSALPGQNRAPWLVTVRRMSRRFHRATGSTASLTVGAGREPDGRQVPTARERLAGASHTGQTVLDRDVLSRMEVAQWLLGGENQHSFASLKASVSAPFPVRERVKSEASESACSSEGVRSLRGGFQLHRWSHRKRTSKRGQVNGQEYLLTEVK